MTRLSLAAAFWLILLCTPTQAATCQPQRPDMAAWLQHVKQVCMRHNIDPNLALALAECEGSGNGQRFRFGRVGRYHLPWGIHKCFESRWDLSDWRVCDEVAIRALRHHLNKTGGNLRKALRRYNVGPGFEAYYRRIKWLEARNRRERVFDDRKVY